MAIQSVSAIMNFSMNAILDTLPHNLTKSDEIQHQYIVCIRKLEIIQYRPEWLGKLISINLVH